MELLLNIYAISVIILLIYICLLLRSKPKKNLDAMILLKEYATIASYIKEFEDIAWGLVMTEDLMVTFVDDVSPPESELLIAQKKYITMITEFIGPELKEICYIYFGSRESFLKYLVIRYDLRFKTEITNRYEERIIQEEMQGGN